MYRRWPFGPETQWLCRLANAGQAVPIFMSSLAIVAIACDRYRCIIQPEKRQLSVRASVAVSLAMVVAAVAMSVPLFMGTELKAFVSFNKTTMEDILVCSDKREGKKR